MNILYKKTVETRSSWKPFTDQTISSAIESDQRCFRAHNSPIRSDFWAQNSLIRSDFKHTIAWTMVCIWSGPWSHNRVGNGLILGWSEVIFVFKGLIRDGFERTSSAYGVSSALSSNQILVGDGLIRVYFRPERPDQKSLQPRKWKAIKWNAIIWNCNFLNYGVNPGHLRDDVS